LVPICESFTDAGNMRALRTAREVLESLTWRKALLPARVGCWHFGDIAGQFPYVCF